MAAHTRAVARSSNSKFLIADLPFLSYRKGRCAAMRAVGELIRNGAHAVKLEGVYGHESIITNIVGSGVPVMGHIGLTPQSINQLGGFRVQGTTDRDAERVRRQAHLLQELGCFSVVLECVPEDLATRITAELTIPTIGIGAGACTDGQVLVLHDVLGLSADTSPRFVRKYIDGFRVLTDALNKYDGDVKETRFPGPSECYR
jgi:3-methyl-2-oxobutanoate hydroxymethyltransferase